MKRNLIALCMAGVLALTLTACASPTAQSQLPETVTVRGGGEVLATPDIAVLHLGVESTGATSEAAREANAKAIDATVAAMQQLGIAEEDIQTSGLYLYPRYNEQGNPNGYRMGVDMTITVREMDRAGAAIDAAIASGSNTFHNISYELSDESSYYGQALEAAVQSARTSAEQIAAADGRTVGKMLSVEELSRGAVVRANPGTGGKNLAMAESASADTAILAGSSRITAEVQVVFELH